MCCKSNAKYTIAPVATSRQARFALRYLRRRWTYLATRPSLYGPSSISPFFVRLESAIILQYTLLLATVVVERGSTGG